MKTVREPVTGAYLNLVTVRVITGKWCVKGLLNYNYKREPDYFHPGWRTFATFETRELAIDFAENLVQSWKELCDEQPI